MKFWKIIITEDGEEKTYGLAAPKSMLKPDVKKTLKHSDLIISVSNYTKAKAKSIINLNLEIHVIPNFVNMETFQPVDRKNFLNDYGLSNDDIILLSLSRLVRRKGHHIIIESIK